MPYIKSSKTMKSLICTLALAGTLVASAMAQPSREEVYGKHRHFVGSSLFMLMNFIPEPPHFYQLNLGYRITKARAIGYAHRGHKLALPCPGGHTLWP